MSPDPLFVHCVVVPGIILPIVEPALLTLEMMTKPKPSFSSLETVTS